MVERVVESVAPRSKSEVKKRHIPFSGMKNFRDLGGYQTADGRTTRWGVLFRSDSLHKLSAGDVAKLSALSLDRVIDFRSALEKEQRPDQVPADIHYVEIPILDASTRVWHESRDDMVKDMRRFDPFKYMTETNIELATQFTPEFRRFVHEVLSSNGRPLLFHCAAGKDRTGFGSAILLRILGVPQETILQDYTLTDKYMLGGYKWNLMLAQVLKGKPFADGVRGFMRAHPAYLSAAFLALEEAHGSFEKYVHAGLGLTEADVEKLKHTYLE